jgi:hypothetical protein
MASLFYGLKQLCVNEKESEAIQLPRSFCQK